MYLQIHRNYNEAIAVKVNFLKKKVGDTVFDKIPWQHWKTALRDTLTLEDSFKRYFGNIGNQP